MSFSTLPLDPSQRGIAEAASRVVYIERTIAFFGQGRIRLSDGLSQIPGGLSFNAIDVSTTVKNYHLENVVLDANTLVVFQDNAIIPETAYFIPQHGITPRVNELTELVRLDAGEDWVIGYNNAHMGYQHWLTQCVPAIDWSLKQLRTRGVRLILPRMEAWQNDILDILGYSFVPRFTPLPGRQYLLPQCEYSDFLYGKTSFDICLSALYTAKRILRRVPDVQCNHSILYVPCSSPYYGSIQNEAEVVDILLQQGAFVVDRRKLTTTERINLFSHADVVIGPLGQDLTDVLFCRPGTLLWEWMPTHHQNASFNRLAQAAQLDYWGDLFGSVDNAVYPRQWKIDLSILEARLIEISSRLTRLSRYGDERVFEPDTNLTDKSALSNVQGKPLEDLMLAFESLGDNCEFGLVQRAGGAEPLGLLRFAGVSFENLVSSLERRFEGLGSCDSVTVFLAGEPGHREFMVHETSLDTKYHTFIREGSVDAEKVRRDEVRRLAFLRRKMLEDLAEGEKIWVWKQQSATDADQVRPLLEILRRLGPNILLWVVEADVAHPPGTVEALESDFMKGYIERFAPYDNAPDIRPRSWFQVCQSAYMLRHRNKEVSENGEAIVVPQALLAMESLAQLQSPLRASSPSIQITLKEKLSELWNWFRPVRHRP